MPVGIPQLRALVAVVDEGSFSAAATRLGISQSAVSHAVASLEQATGRPVLSRPGPPRTTVLGEQVLAQARVAVTAVRAVEELAARRDGHPSGSIALAAPPTVCHALVPALLEQWRADFPGVAISLFEGEDEEVAGWLDSAVADLAVLVDPPHVPDHAVVLDSDVFHAVLRADHPLAAQDELDVADLYDDDFLLSTGGCERAIREIHRGGAVPFAPIHRIRQLGTLFAMVRAGVGVSIVPGSAAGMVGPDVVLVPLRECTRRSLVLSGPLHRPWHPAATALVRATSPVDRCSVGHDDPGWARR